MLLCALSSLNAATITVDAGQVEGEVSPLIYGAGTEDVNHEIYGGIYDQRIFGESFEEPHPSPPVLGWTSFGGQWMPVDGQLNGRGSDGGKMILDEPQFEDGSFAFDMRFPHPGDGNSNAGAIVRVANAAKGADAFDGYEVGLTNNGHRVILARHRQNYTPLAEGTVAVNPGEWQRLRVELAGPRIRVFVNDAKEPAIDFTDTEPLPEGSVGFRTWRTDAEFRQPVVETGGRRETIAMTAGEPTLVSGMWDPVQTGSAEAEFEIVSDDAFNGRQAQKIRHAGGTGEVGIANRSLNRWGIAVREGNTYSGRIYLRGKSPNARVTVSLQNVDGSRTYAKQTLPPPTSQWTKMPFDLKSSATDPNARFAVTLDKPGIVEVDQAVLMGPPSEQYKGLPLRKDIAEGMKAQGLTFLRYGGTMINAPEYRWKKMIGDRDKRPPYDGHWYDWSTNGFGIEEFLQWCEASGYEASFAINVEETPEDMADMVEYLNGPATSEWGRKRAENGHPKPYGVKYIEIGNEEVLWGNYTSADYHHYIERFKILAKAMKEVDPNLELINAAWWREDDAANCEKVFKALDGLATYWDFHTWADDPKSGTEVDRILTEAKRRFTEWKPDHTMQIVILEENGFTHNMARALGHATTLNAVRRHGIKLDSAANALQPWLQNDNGWDQGQVFFTPDKVWLMPPAYAQRMASDNHLPMLVKSTVDGSLDVTATKSEDERTLVLHVVNTGDSAETTSIRLNDFSGVKPEGKTWTLAGDLQDRNTPDEPERVKSIPGILTDAGDDFPYTFPPHSYTVLRMER